jgi:peptidoglycan/LPS O-acetylase OafA/YrhL
VDARPEAPSFGYQPALDGVRALAVVAVLLFHLGLGWMPGGYLGVSVFFTLSGFLITRLLLGEHERSGNIDLFAFYQRRARRLIPAGLLVLGLVCVAAITGWVEPRSTFRRDLWASMFQVLNWVKLFGRERYADLFTAPSPVAHYWSLGIEEQFYVVWPAVLLALLAVLHRRGARHRLLPLLAALFAVTAVSAPLTARWWSPDATYYATWTRAAEVLAGVVLAAWLHGRQAAQWLRWLALPALVVIVVACVVTPSGRGWAFDGGLPVFALVSATLVAALQVQGPVRTALSARPLVWVGRISYGLYLLHWPVFVVLDGERTGLRGWPLHVLRLAVTFVLAIVSYRLLEHPIRARRVVPSAAALTAALGTGVLVVGGAALAVDLPTAAPLQPIPSIVTASPTTVVAPEPSADSGPSPTTNPTASTAPPAAPTVLGLFGDSVPAWLVRDGAAGFDRFDVVLVNGAKEACDGLIDMPPALDRFGAELLPPADCVPWDRWYPTVLDDVATAAGHTVGIAVLMLGQAPVLDHRIDGRWLPPCESIDWYLRDLDRRIDLLRGRGLGVVFALPAPLGQRATFSVPDDHLVRMGCVRAALSQHLVQRYVPVVDMQDVLCPQGDCEALRTRDGVHVDPDRAAQVLRWLVDRVLDLRPAG